MGIARVIGKYFEDGEGIGYLQHASGKDGGIYFQTPEGFYDDALGGNRELMEEINEEYIRRSIEGGIYRIDLVEETIAKVQDTIPGTFSDAEINWITETIRKINQDPAYDFTDIIENNPFGGVHGSRWRSTSLGRFL